ncbi:UNVERIFIED_CONTAM: hypothetical protein FKN15_035122 [Acipenser sinensis]
MGEAIALEQFYHVVSTETQASIRCHNPATLEATVKLAEDFEGCLISTQTSRLTSPSPPSSRGLAPPPPPPLIAFGSRPPRPPTPMCSLTSLPWRRRMAPSWAHRYHLCADSGGVKMNTRCPPKRVPSAACFFTRCELTVQLPQSYSVGGQRSFGQLTGKPAGVRPDYRGRWCAVSRGHPGRPNPPSPRTTLGQLSAAPWKLPSTVGCEIAWTQTLDVQAIERILHSSEHSSECFYWMRHSGAPTSPYIPSIMTPCLMIATGPPIRGCHIVSLPGR